MQVCTHKHPNYSLGGQPAIASGAAAYVQGGSGSFRCPSDRLELQHIKTETATVVGGFSGFIPLFLKATIFKHVAITMLCP